MSDQQHVQINVDKPTGPDAPPPPAQNDRPAWLPEKFKTPEELVNSYKELETKLGSKPADDKPQDQQQQQTPPPAENDLSINADADAAAQKAVADAGLDFDKLSDEFSTNGGKLKDESYEALSKRGIPKALVDEFINLKVKEANTIVSEMKSIAGGDEGFAAMSKWAAEGNYKNLQAYNTMVQSGDPGQMRLAVEALHAAYVAANGKSPSLIKGDTGGVGNDVYRDQAEWMRDIQDPRYRTSPAFRKDVEAKTARSPAIFA